MKALESSSLVFRDPTLVSAQLDDEVVMMDAEQGTYYGLNETSGMIWQLLEQPSAVETVVAQLLKTYEVERAQCEREVLVLLEDMRTRGLIKVVDEAA